METATVTLKKGEGRSLKAGGAEEPGFMTMRSNR